MLSVVPSQSPTPDDGASTIIMIPKWVTVSRKVQLPLSSTTPNRSLNVIILQYSFMARFNSFLDRLKVCRKYRSHFIDRIGELLGLSQYRFKTGQNKMECNDGGTWQDTVARESIKPTTVTKTASSSLQSFSPLYTVVFEFRRKGTSNKKEIFNNTHCSRCCWIWVLLSKRRTVQVFLQSRRLELGERSDRFYSVVTQFYRIVIV